jgi:hypothetical protein
MMSATTAGLLFLLLLVAASTPLFAAGADAKPRAAAPKTMQVLWIGNSYTAVNDLPAVVEAMVNEGHAGMRMKSHRYLSGGKDWRWHHDDPKSQAAALVRKGGFDFVVLQDQSAGAIARRKDMMDYGAKFAELIRSRGGEPVFYCTWARASRPHTGSLDEDYRLIVSGYEELARRHKAPLAPVGPAWREALRQRPKLVLHASDGSHPTPAGTYLAACVFYATLTGKSPVGLTAARTFVRYGKRDKDGKRPRTQTTIDDDTARFLQETAWAVCRQRARALRTGG